MAWRICCRADRDVEVAAPGQPQRVGQVDRLDHPARGSAWCQRAGEAAAPAWRPTPHGRARGRSRRAGRQRRPPWAPAASRPGPAARRSTPMRSGPAAPPGRSASYRRGGGIRGRGAGGGAGPGAGTGRLAARRPRPRRHRTASASSHAGPHARCPEILPHALQVLLSRRGSPTRKVSLACPPSPAYLPSTSSSHFVLTIDPLD